MVHVVNNSRDHDGETFELGNFRSRLCQFYVAESGVRNIERVREVMVRIGAVQFRNFVEEYAQLMMSRVNFWGFAGIGLVSY